MTPARSTVYLVPPPGVEPGLDFINEWTQPRIKNPSTEKAVEFPDMEDVLGYLQAFYLGLPVKILPSPNPCFTADVEEDIEPAVEGLKAKGKKKTSKPKSPTLWLNTQKPSGCIGIRTRATPKGSFPHQLNLNDLLDAAIEILPDDAYALLMIVEHDIFEDEDDDFAYGRAYGGSRIAVVSGARYNPILDQDQRVVRDHAWPASHCEQYVRSRCEEVEIEDGGRKKKAMITKSKAVKAPLDIETLPMQAAVAAHASLPSLEQASNEYALSSLWLGRVCRTASHELGHCFGIDHCVYYACAMQGTASIVEDARQPPFLCPIDLAKVLRATGADENARYRALLAFCEKRKEGHLFAAFTAWIQARIGK